jgi:hypothetical protein
MKARSECHLAWAPVERLSIRCVFPAVRLTLVGQLSVEQVYLELALRIGGRARRAQGEGQRGAGLPTVACASAQVRQNARSRRQRQSQEGRPIGLRRRGGRLPREACAAPGCSGAPPPDRHIALLERFDGFSIEVFMWEPATTAAIGVGVRGARLPWGSPRWRRSILPSRWMRPGRKGLRMSNGLRSLA